MKICIVNLASGFGGGENQTLLLAEELRKKGLDLIAVANPKSKLFQKFLELKIPVVTSKNPLAGHTSPALKDVDCFHAHDGRAVHWCYLQKIITQKHYLVTRRVINPIKRNWSTQLAYENADILVGVSHLISQQLASQFPEKNCEMIMDSPKTYDVDLDRLKEMRRIYEKKFIVIQAGSLVRHKGFDVTIQAAKLLSAKEDIQFLFLGDGPEREALLEEANGLKNVEFLGRQENMGDWFALSDCLVLPSRMEGLGSVLLEAMKAQVPVIGTNVGGIPEIVKNNETGILIPNEDPRSLANAILLLKKDDALRNKIVQQAFCLVAPNEIQVAADKYIGLYSQILKR
ncbi:glycosyltransferase family 4 protein [Turicimonas muris]|uniref:glycosyltransferase family 4 protein n=3 Tax=Turicimonas muris TaxID=1796652 RepID=UPI0023F5603A|nr:glycosyltransferase family 4 protein [Turicimonas muris]